MINYRFANERDMESIIDFINMVFSMLRVPHDFGAMLPKAYGREISKPEIHAIAEEDGRICGCLGMLEFPLTVCGRTLRVGYLGSMSVHPRLRGQGVMKVLMEMQIAAGKEKGLDMMVLGGQRQRYQYYGFETCGGTYSYSISAANVRHALRDTDISDLTFPPMAQADVPFAKALYEKQPVTGARTEESFLACVRSYREQPHMILRGGQPQGYIVLAEDGVTVTELLTRDAALILPAVKGFMQMKGLRSLHVEAAPHDTRLNGALAPICEHFTVSPNSMLRVLRPETVISAYMALKNTYEPLCDGELTVGLGEMGAYRIAVKGGEAAVGRAEGGADVALGAIDMNQLLFGYNPYAVPDHARGKAPAGWFPLPYHIPTPDSF